MATNTFKFSGINAVDRIDESREFCLDSENRTGKDLIVLYIYRLPSFQTHGFKVGMTKCNKEETFWHAIKSRINDQQHELALTEEQYEKYGKDREVVYWGVCLDAKNESFKDYYVHDVLKQKYAALTEQQQEWFNGLPLEDIVKAFDEIRQNGQKKEIYKPRKEQKDCIDALSEYFSRYPKGHRFLLNCKMRFGKCYTTYKFCEENNINKILILTFVPAVQESWHDDLYHIEKRYDYFTDDDLQKSVNNKSRYSKITSLLDDNQINTSNNFDITKENGPYVIFLSLQNYLGKESELKATKEKIAQLQQIDFDLVVLDEYHFGAWNDRTQETILEDFDPKYVSNIRNKKNSQDVIKNFKINTKKTICLSGTPFKAIERGEFNEENSFTYSYFDEQMNKYPKHEENNLKVVNPDYADFPDMKIFGYNMSNLFEGFEGNVISKDKLLGKKYFSLNKFFETNKDSGVDQPVSFVYEDQIKTWLQIIKGSIPLNGQDFPYSNPKLCENNKHTLWLLPTQNACKAMEKLLIEDNYFSRYQIINLSQNDVGSGVKAFEYLKTKMNEAENTHKLGSIAITVNKLTIGVTVKEWSSVFVLKDLASPESYFQSIFRIQNPNKKDGKILKKEAYVFDFNIDRAASLMLKFAEQSQDKSTSKLQTSKLIVKFMPIYLNGNMDTPIDEKVFYELAQYGDTSGKPLSRRIQNISQTTRIEDEETLSELLNDPECSEVLKQVFAHAKFPKNKKSENRQMPYDPEEGFSTEARDKGQKDGKEKGIADSNKYIDFDQEECQKEYEEACKRYVSELCPQGYDEKQKVYYENGFVKGYENGVNVPIKKLQCGKDDGIKFAKDIRARYGSDVYYEGNNKALIVNETNKYLNNDDNIPEQYQSFLYKRWYKESFSKAVKNSMRKYVKPKDGESVEDVENILKHLLARLFQFLYISVYRETTFTEIFNNASPEVFLEAVGITKEDFELINRHNVFQEDVLNNCIHEFFVNETLGGKLDLSNDYVKENYRNSFAWFGSNEVDE